jgi:hypothetical protein
MVMTCLVHVDIIQGFLCGPRASMYIPCAYWPGDVFGGQCDWWNVLQWQHWWYYMLLEPAKHEHRNIWLIWYDMYQLYDCMSSKHELFVCIMQMILFTWMSISFYLKYSAGQQKLIHSLEEGKFKQQKRGWDLSQPRKIARDEASVTELGRLFQ